MTDRGYTWHLHDPGQHIGRIIEQSGAPYEVTVLRAMAAAYRPNTGVLDIGAHVGNHAIYMAKVCGAIVVAFEPYPASYRQLAENVMLNGLGAQVFTVPAAVGASPGTASFGDASPENIAWGKVPATTDDAGTIDQVTIDGCDLENISVVKVDVEGLEPEVLAGAVHLLERERPVVFTEAQTADAGARNATVLSTLGYRLRATLNQRRTPVQQWEPG